jgi:hypothetical protein
VGAPHDKGVMRIQVVKQLLFGWTRRHMDASPTWVYGNQIVGAVDLM